MSDPNWYSTETPIYFPSSVWWILFHSLPFKHTPKKKPAEQGVYNWTISMWYLVCMLAYCKKRRRRYLEHFFCSASTNEIFSLIFVDNNLKKMKKAGKFVAASGRRHTVSLWARHHTIPRPTCALCMVWYIITKKVRFLQTLGKISHVLNVFSFKNYWNKPEHWTVYTVQCSTFCLCLSCQLNLYETKRVTNANAFGKADMVFDKYEENCGDDVALP